VYALTFLLRNDKNYFTKGHAVNSILSIQEFLVEVCKSAYSLDALNRVKDRFLIATLAGRQDKMLKTVHAIYQGRDLINLDAAYFFLFNGTPTFVDKKNSEIMTEQEIKPQQGPMIFRKLIREKLLSKQVEKLNTPDMFELIAHFILMHLEPVCNKFSQTNKHLI